MTVMRKKTSRLPGAMSVLQHVLTGLETRLSRIWKTKIRIQKRPLDLILISARKTTEHDTQGANP